MNRQILHSLHLLTLSGALLFSTSAVASEVHLGKSAVSKQDIIQLLAPAKTNTPINTRGLRLHKSGQSQAATVSANPVSASAVTADSRSLSMEIYFEFNSARLSNQAMDKLVPVGEALRSNELAGINFTLEGHTDAAGAADYNMQLSRMRAQSVKNFFVQQFQVPGNRISAVGKGETELLDAANPRSEVNRRVKIIAW